MIDNRWLTVTKESVNLPNGECIDDFYSVTIPDASAIVAVTDDNEIVLKKEYKHAKGEELIEVPACMFEPEEKDGLAVAKRELLEEKEHTSEEWEYLSDTVKSSSKLTNKMHIYLATN